MLGRDSERVAPNENDRGLKRDVPNARTLCGIVPAVVTPFGADEALDLDALERLIDRLIAQGVHGLCVLGSQGEFFALDRDEHREVVRAAVSAAGGRVPVFAGVSAAATRDAIALARAAEAAGADGLLSLPPLFVQPRPAEVIDHYEALAASVELPLLLYNQPARVGVALSVATVATLAATPNIAGIKDSSGSLAQCLAYRQALPEDFTVLIGHDSLVAYALLGGADGSIASSGNFAAPELCGIWEAVRNGDAAEATRLQARVATLREAFDLASFPVAVIKEALALQGCPVGAPRRPVHPLRPDAREALRSVLDQLATSND
ncbi:MAG TPA: 4-hydroxy-tetrahydrodipicolinate synthase [Baekduia sp.]|uniref:4-hydroxy-tetrahydrodipicolinate synthase n=1 Tax=Baekduia sp. TaxID=2600305 RepID=UPI002D764B4D|nr:4-hydroxy-tetrahydrodipicolinate synthase [Baekduia sp.]HET6507965.1 4-hydroxy-tetrahydrodipicolinate synthase [Baekduia sp.]